MSQAASQRGAAAVGYLHDLTPIEASAVLYLRLWCEGPDAQEKINSDFRILVTAPLCAQQVAIALLAACATDSA